MHHHIRRTARPRSLSQTSMSSSKWRIREPFAIDVLMSQARPPIRASWIDCPRLEVALLCFVPSSQLVDIYQAEIHESFLDRCLGASTHASYSHESARLLVLPTSPLSSTVAWSAHLQQSQHCILKPHHPRVNGLWLRRRGRETQGCRLFLNPSWTPYNRHLRIVSVSRVAFLGIDVLESTQQRFDDRPRPHQ
jgi:hypothetical protein